MLEFPRELLKSDAWKFPLWLSGNDPTSMHEHAILSLASLSGLRIRHCGELWCKSQTWLGSGLLWLWRGPGAAALIQPWPLTWARPHAIGEALKRPKKKNLMPESIPKMSDLTDLGYAWGVGFFFFSSAGNSNMARLRATDLNEKLTFHLSYLRQSSQNKDHFSSQNNNNNRSIPVLDSMA